MKKLLLTLAMIFITVLAFSQATTAPLTRILNATTPFGVNISVGTHVYDINADITYVCITATVNTLTLTTGSANFSTVGSGLVNPMTTQGDIITGGSGGTAQRLAKGAEHTVLNMNATDPEWGLLDNDNIGASGVADIDHNKLVAIATNVALETDASGFIVASAVTNTELNLLDGLTIAMLRTPLVHWDEVAADDLTTPYPITLAQTPAANSTITVQVNGVPLKYEAGTTAGTFNFSGTNLDIYVPVYQYDRVEVHYEY